MHISWLGSTAIKLQTKSETEDISVVIDPYKPENGTFPRSLSADIALYTHGEKDSITISGNPFTLSTVGECEVKGVLITAVQGKKEHQTVLRLDSEGMSIGHTGSQNGLLTDEQLNVLSGVDILCISVGDEKENPPEKVVKSIQTIEPRIVIPMAYKSDNSPSAAPITTFIKEIGIEPKKEANKVIIKKKDLPQEEMQLIVITKE
ncbi:MAG: hypothetical protein CL685_01465 [Candidatus Magasanikbacteria bacterium]|nr:hypothetical protein [Candidatus Magasanikbacteria bacterium]|tara:strand:+ start:1637 stop:2251 length:615 start_codon:yes stop_codon:yes gene_type:complete